MTAPGAGEGVSWVDVAASAAGIYAQMQAIGAQAAEGLSRGLASQLPGMITPVVHGSFQAALTGLEGRAAATAAGAATAEAFGASFRQTLAGSVGNAVREGFSGTLSLPVEGIANDVARSLAKVGPALRTSLQKELREAFAAAEAGALGERAGQSVTAGFSQGVGGIRQTLQTLWGSGAIGEAQAAAAGARIGQAVTGGLRQTLTALSGGGGWLDQVMGEHAIAAAQARMAQLAATVAGGLGSNLRETLERSSAVAADAAAESAITRLKVRLGPDMVAAFGNVGANAARSAGDSAAAMLTQAFGALPQVGASTLASAGAQIGANLTASMQLRKQMAEEFAAAQAGTSAAATQFGSRMGQFLHGGLVGGVGDFRSFLTSMWEGGAVETAQAAAAGARIGQALTGGLRQTIAELSSSGGIAAAIENAAAAANASAAAAGAAALARVKQLTLNAFRFDELGMQLAPQFSEAGAIGAQALGQGFQGHLAGITNKFMPASMRPAVNAFFGQVGRDAGSAFRATGTQEFEEATRAMGGKMLSGWDKIGGQGAAAAANAAGKMSTAMKAGMAGAILLGAATMEAAVKNTINLINSEVAAFGKAGKDAADALMGGFKSVVEGQMPDVGRLIGAGLQGIKTAMELPLNAMSAGLSTVFGQIPILGGMIQSVAGEAQQVLGGLFAAIQGYTSIAGQFGGILLDVGNKWQEAARTIAGQTLGVEHLQDYLGIVRDIAASGDLVHFKDVAAVVGELNQRLSGLNGGMGMTREQVTELATTLAEGNELLGDTKINVDNLTAAFNSFDVRAEDTNRVLTEFINIARMTGANINELTQDIDTISPALQAMGFSAEEGAMMMGLVNQELGKPAMGRFSYGLAQLPERLDKAGISVNGLVSIVQALIANGDTVENRLKAIEVVQPFIGSAKSAENYVDLIRHHVIPTHEAMAAALRAHQADLVQPIEEALEVTKKFGDTLEQLSNQVQAALAPLGTGLVGKLNELGEGMSSWLQENQGKFIGWVGAVGEKLLEWGGKIGHFLATIMRDMSGTIEFFKNSVVLAVSMVDVAFKQMSAPFMNLQGMFDPTGLIGAMTGIHKATTDALPGLKAMLGFDLGKTFNEGADAVDKAAYSIEGLEGPLAKLVSTSQDAAAFYQASRAEFAKPIKDPLGHFELDERGQVKREASKMQDALGGSLQEGLTIAPDVWDKIVHQFSLKGVNIEGDKVTGQIKAVKANSQQELDGFVKYLNERFGPEQFAQYAAGGKVEFKVEAAPGKTAAQWLQDNIGLPSELAGTVGADGVIRPKFQLEGLPPELQQIFGGVPGTPGGPPAGEPGQHTPPSRPGGWNANPPSWISRATDITQLATELLNPLAAPLNLLASTLGDMGKFQTGGTVSGPGGTDRVPIWATAGEKVMNLGASERFGPELDWMNAQAFQTGGTVLGAAGIPAGMQGGATGGTIALPAGINVVTPQPMSEGETMSRAGVPDKYQGQVQSEGVAVPGVALPTGLDVKDADRQDASGVMTAVGIPSRLQGDDGLKIPVKLELQAGSALPDSTADGGGAGAANYPNPGSVEAWRPNVQAALMRFGGMVGMRYGGMTGVPVGMKYGGMAGIPTEAFPAWEAAIMTQIKTESGGNPNIPASDPNDPNVKAGIPSVGLLQYTPSTYAKYNPDKSLPYPNPDGQIAATLFYAPHDARGYPAAGSRGIGQGHGFWAGGLVGMAGGGPLGSGPLHGSTASLSYHEPSHLAPHVGLPTASTNVFKHMAGGGPLGSGPLHGSTASLSYHEPSHLAPHVGLSTASTNVFKHMQDGGIPGLPAGAHHLPWWERLKQLGKLFGFARGGAPTGDLIGPGWDWPGEHDKPPHEVLPGPPPIIEGFPPIVPHYVAGGLIGMNGGGLLGGPAPGGQSEDAAIVAACRAEGVDPAVWLGPLKVLIGRESGGQQTGWWDPKAIQYGYTDENTLRGNLAMGAAQVTPETAKGVGVDPYWLTGPAANISAAIRYIKQFYAAPAKGRSKGEGGLGKTVDALHAILNVQQADSTMPPHGYQGGGSVYDRNAPWALGGDYRTSLTPQQETAFRQWVRDRKAPFDPNQIHPDYDMRGFWLHSPDRDSWRPGQHFPDTWKTPYHHSFSNESMYAKTGTPFQWKGDRLIDGRTGVPVPGFASGGVLEGFFKGIFGELGFTLPEASSGDSSSSTDGHTSFWDQLTHPDTKGMADGGHIKGVHWPGRDSVPMDVPAGTFIMNRHRSAQYRDIIDRIMGTGYAGGGLIPIITEPGERVIPPGAAPPGLLNAMNQGALLRRAGGGQTGVLQVIYNPPGTSEYYGEAAGFGRVGPGTSQPQYYNADWGGHHGHVHTSFETGPNGEPYGMPAGTNLPGGGKEHPEFASAGFPWIAQLGRRYGLYASTYPGHQEHGGKNHGLDWWPVGKADMSGLSYTPEERDRLRSFASAMVSTGSGQGGATWGSGFSSGTGSAMSGRHSSVRAALKAILPPWLSRALGLQTGGMVPMQGGGDPIIVPSPSGQLGGDGPPVAGPRTWTDDAHGWVDAIGNVYDAATGGAVIGTWHGPGTFATIVLAGGGRKQDPNLPTSPEPVGPYDPTAPGNQPPPWASKAKVDATTPGAVPTPYGSFVYPTPANPMGMSREEAEKFIDWLHKQEKATERGVDDQNAVNAANQAEVSASTRLRSAQDDYWAIINDAKKTYGEGTDAYKNFIATQMKAGMPLATATDELTAATNHEKETSKALTKAKEAQHDAIIDQSKEAFAKPPWEGKEGKDITPDENAAAMGAGLVKGVAQELGFGDVFAKPPWQWGLWKLFAGGASYAMGIANAMGEAKGGYGGAAAAAGVGPFDATGQAQGPAGQAPGPGPQQAGEQPSGTDSATGLPIYKLANGEEDRPDALGGYAAAHGPDWDFQGKGGKGRFYPKGKAPGKPPSPETQGAPAQPGSDLANALKQAGEGAYTDPVPGSPGQSQLKKKDGTVVGIFDGATGKKIGEAPGGPPAGPPTLFPSPVPPPSPAAPGPPVPKMPPGWKPGDPIPGAPGGPQVGPPAPQPPQTFHVAQPPGPAPPGKKWDDAWPGRWVDEHAGGGQAGGPAGPWGGSNAAFGAGDGGEAPGFGGGGGGGMNFMDKLMHPARNALMSAYQRGGPGAVGLPAPRSPSEVSSWMPASGTPAGLPNILSAMLTDFTRGPAQPGLSVTQNIAPVPGDDAKKFVQSSYNSFNRAPQMAGGAGTPIP